MVRFLFSQGHVSDMTRKREQDALEAVAAVPAERIIRDPVEEIAAELATNYRVDEPQLVGKPYLVDGVQETMINRRQAPQGLSWMDGLGPIHGQRVEVRQRFDGAPQLLDIRPSSHGLNFPEGDVQDHEVIVVIERPAAAMDAEQVKREIEARFSQIENLLGNLRRDVDAFNRTLPAMVQAAIEQRKARILQGSEMVAYLGFPVVRRDDPSPALAVEVPRRRPVRVEQLRTATSQRSQERFVNADDFDEIVSTLGTLRRLIERLPETFSQFGEEALRDVLLLVLNNQFGPATGESFSRAGKTDILIQTPEGPVFIAECKIWGGKKRFAEGINQLLSYLTWRDTKAAMIVFVREAAVTEIAGKALETLREHGQFVRPAKPIDADPVVILHHEGDPLRQLRVALIIVALPAIGTTLREEARDA